MGWQKLIHVVLLNAYRRLYLMIYNPLPEYSLCYPFCRLGNCTSLFPPRTGTEKRMTKTNKINKKSLPVHRSCWEPLCFFFLPRRAADQCNDSGQFHNEIPSCCFLESLPQNWKRITDGSVWRSNANLDRKLTVWSIQVPWVNFPHLSSDGHCHWIGHVTRICRSHQLVQDEICRTLEL